jgi:hypothetical protein
MRTSVDAVRRHTEQMLQNLANAPTLQTDTKLITEEQDEENTSS